MVTVLSLISLLIWLYLLFGHHDFWKADQRLKAPKDSPNNQPHTVILVPARNEEETIGVCLTALAKLTYSGPLDIVLIDDNSDDQTHAIATKTAQEFHETGPKIHIVSAAPLEEGWTGKLGALHQGLEYTEKICRTSPISG